MRQLILALVLSVLFAAVCAQMSPAEQRWKREEAASGNEILNILIPLKQRNLDKLHALAADLTNPDSPNFAQWWTKEQILDLVAPEKSVAESVAHFLLKAGFISVDISFRDSIRARADVATISNVFSTKFHYYRLDKDIKGEKRIVRALDGYTIPAEIAEHVDFVSGIEELPFPTKKPVAPFVRTVSSVGTVDPNYVIPETIVRLYNITDIPTNKNSSLCLAEFQDDASFSKEDNKKFFTETLAHTFDVVKIVGPYQPQEPDGESSLDVQYGGAVGLGTDVWFWTVQGWMLEFSTDLSNADEFPLVVSMSWGWPEMWQCAGSSPPGNCKGMSNEQYIAKVNAEFAKSVARGVTLLASSGDTGAPGDVNPDCDDRKDPISNSFPASSPYATAIGATMLAKSSQATAPAQEPPICKKYTCSTSDSELVCTYPDALITTGGGFSTYITQPVWQTDAVNGYLGSGVALPPANTFNKAGRAYPDVSALGHNYLVIIGGQWTPVDGTSCSSPVWAGMVALINSARLNAGKKPIGHIAPILYKAATVNPNIFHDQTTGNNKCTEDCCAKVGFEATKGWDPVTGLGTPNFGLLLDYINTLP